MGVVRTHKKRHNFSTIDNTGAEDDSLTPQAKGVLWYLLTKPDGWEIRNEHLMKKLNIGRTALDSIIRNLEESEYLIRVKVRKEGGVFDWISEVFETPEDCHYWKEANQSLLEKALKGSTNRRAAKKIKTSVDHCMKSSAGSSADGSSVAGQSGSLLNTDSVITDQDKKINEINMIKPIEDVRCMCDEFEFFDHHGKQPVEAEPIRSTNPPLSETDQQCISGEEKRSLDQSECSDFSLKKEKVKKSKLKEQDDLGIYILPSSGKNRLPSLLTIRSVQFILAINYLDCEVHKDADGEIWLSEFDDDQWYSEEEFCTGSERMPYRKAVDKVLYNGYADVDEVNDLIEYWWNYWGDACP